MKKAGKDGRRAKNDLDWRGREEEGEEKKSKSERMNEERR